MKCFILHKITLGFVSSLKALTWTVRYLCHIFLRLCKRVQGWVECNCAYSSSLEESFKVEWGMLLIDILLVIHCLMPNNDQNWWCTGWISMNLENLSLGKGLEANSRLSELTRKRGSTRSWGGHPMQEILPAKVEISKTQLIGTSLKTVLLPSGNKQSVRNMLWG